MSFIDCWKHEWLGNVGGAPVYRALETISGEFEAQAGDIIIGGGSGELSATVFTPYHLKDTEISLPYFKNEETEESLKLEEEWYEATEDHPENGIMRLREIGNDWSGDEWYSIVEQAMSEGYVRKGAYTIEVWLAEGALRLSTIPSEVVETSD